MHSTTTISSHAQQGSVFVTVKGAYYDQESGLASISLGMAARDRLNDKVESETEALIDVDSAEALISALGMLVKQARNLEADHAF